jgi:hypothetical protein
MPAPRKTNAHPAVSPFRPSRSAAEAHQAHGTEPFVGCAICELRPRMTPLQFGWIATPERQDRAA